MRALESAPVIADYNRLYRRFHGTPSKSDRVPGNRRFLDAEEKAICRYLDRLDKLGLLAQRVLQLAGGLSTDDIFAYRPAPLGPVKVQLYLKVTAPRTGSACAYCPLGPGNILWSKLLRLTPTSPQVFGYAPFAIPPRLAPFGRPCLTSCLLT
jgi:hypothetical protein